MARGPTIIIIIIVVVVFLIFGVNDPEAFKKTEICKEAVLACSKVALNR